MNKIISSNKEYEYDESKRLGNGGNANIYEINNSNLVVKICRFHNPIAVQRFKYEAEIVKKISTAEHDLVPRFVCSGEINKGNKKEPYYIMQKYTTLKEIIENKEMAFLEKMNLLRNIISNVYHIHNSFNIAHRDLKPNNILIDSSSNDKIPLLCDFGLAIGNDRSKDINTGIDDHVGSYTFRAPELRKHNPVLTNEDYYKSDIYAFGKMAYAILNDSLISFEDGIDYLTTDLDIQHYTNVSQQEKFWAVEIVYEMINKCIVNNYENRINEKDCIEYIDKAIKAFGDIGQFLDYTKILKFYRSIRSELKRHLYIDYSFFDFSIFEGFIFKKNNVFVNFDKDYYKSHGCIEELLLSSYEKEKNIESQCLLNESLKSNLYHVKFKNSSGTIIAEKSFLLTSLNIDDNNNLHLFVFEFDSKYVDKTFQHYVITIQNETNIDSNNQVFENPYNLSSL